MKYDGKGDLDCEVFWEGCSCLLILWFAKLFTLFCFIKSWRQHPTRHQLYGHLPPITKTIQARRTRHAGHCWRSSDELISDVLLWTPTHGRAKAGRPAQTYIQQLCEDTGCSPEDLPEVMNDGEKWRERVRDIRATSTTWWWWSSSSFSYVPFLTPQNTNLCLEEKIATNTFADQNNLLNKYWEFKS